ncbi:MAG: amidase [Clostridia bacterium]|nr:amidase [Clostridia bacterium]
MEWLNEICFNIEEATIKGMAEALEKGTIDSQSLVQVYLKRIADLDKSGPKLNSVLEINPDALHIAEALDRERQLTGPRSILHGIPIMIKDNLNTHDKMHTSAGSVALAENYAPYDAFVVEKLKAAGAIIFGKTNLTEFANFMTEGMPNGYSSRGGQVLNPYGPGKFDTGGSSAGSGVAVAANLCTAAVGTETSGSIISPACCNSIVGIKPTLGMISRTGIVPIAHSQDTAGPMARTVEDAAILLGAMTAIDTVDPVTYRSKNKTNSDYTKFLDKNGLKGSRIGVPKYVFEELKGEALEMMHQCIEEIKQLGAEVIEDKELDSYEKLDNYDVLIYEFKSDLNSYLSTLNGASKMKTLKDIIEYNNNNPGIALKYGQTLLVKCEAISGTLTEPEYISAKLQDLRLSSTDGIDAFMADNKVDAMLFPSTAGVSMAAKAGYPSIAVPGGYCKDGTPFGITFSAEAFSEPKLIKFAYAYEQATKKRIMPKF